MTARAAVAATACLVVGCVVCAFLVLGGDAAHERPEPAFASTGLVTSRGMSGLVPVAPRTIDAIVVPPDDASAATRCADDELPRLVKQLANCRTHVAFLRTMTDIAGPLTDDDGAIHTRFDDAPEATRDLLTHALEIARHPLARQMITMHIAVTSPSDEARRRLQPLLDGDDSDDREDALLALAFRGEPRAVADFLALASEPSPALVRRSLFRDAEILERGVERAVLRSYRALELVLGRPYFHLDARAYESRGCSAESFPWGRDDGASPDVEQTLLEAWRDRYPGHCGSDNVSMMLARRHLEAGRPLQALREASRASTEPDAGERDAALALCLALVEYSPIGSPVVSEAIDPLAPERNADLLLYARARRYAAEYGWAAGLAEVARVAATRPDLVLSRAYRDRWQGGLPGGLDSGLAPIPAGDPLRRHEWSDEPELDQPWDELEVERWYRSYDTNDRPVAVQIDLDITKHQLRLWESLLALEQAEARTRGDARLDLAYKRAAIHFHSADVLYPVYASHHASLSGRPDRSLLPEAGFLPIDSREWHEGVLHWTLAARGFLAMAYADPGHPLADDALFSAGIAHVRAADDRLVQSERDPTRRGHIAQGVQIFERLARDYPLSPLADDAAAAVRYWRRRDLRFFAEQ